MVPSNLRQKYQIGYELGSFYQALRFQSHLVGYVVTANRGDQPPAGLSEYLRQTLPDYMVPAAYMVLPELPLTRSGLLSRSRGMTEQTGRQVSKTPV